MFNTTAHTSVYNTENMCALCFVNNYQKGDLEIETRRKKAGICLLAFFSVVASNPNLSTFVIQVQR